MIVVLLLIIVLVIVRITIRVTVILTVIVTVIVIVMVIVVVIVIVIVIVIAIGTTMGDLYLGIFIPYRPQVSKATARHLRKAHKTLALPRLQDPFEGRFGVNAWK